MSTDHDLPVDPDVDARRDPVAGLDVLVAVSVGGALGSLGRWGLGELAGTAPSGFPWATLTVNITGSLLLGSLMVLVAEVRPGSRYLRPFAGVGLLGGWTTFSTYALDTRSLLVQDRTAAALLYVGGSLLGGVLAVLVGLRLARVLLR